MRTEEVCHARDALIAIQATHRRGTKEIANLGVLAQVCPQAAPKVIEGVFVLVFGLDKAAAQLKALIQKSLHSWAVREKRVGVKRFGAALTD